MPRIEPLIGRKAGLYRRMMYALGRPTIKKKIGRSGAPDTTPFAVAAHNGWIMHAFGLFELLLGRAGHVPTRYKNLARMRAGAVVGCAW